jgi:formate hydrogenlyase subunit 3/multisubunit Na+/H+ antiporter MnhD subunit
MEIIILMLIILSLALFDLKFNKPLTSLVAATVMVAATVLIKPGTTFIVPFMESALFTFNSNALEFLRIIAILYFVLIPSSFEYYDGKKTNFYTLATFLLFAMLGVAVSNTWYGMMTFWEMITIIGFLLVFPSNKEVARNYLIIQLIGAGLLLFAMTRTIGITGSHYLSEVPKELYMLFLISMGFKFGIAGVHFWLPEAHGSAAAPASALLSGIMVKIGLFGIYKVGVINYRPFLIFGFIMIFWGGFRAIIEKDVKRILAFSTISQMGLGTVLFASGVDELFSVFMVFVIHHGFAKVSLFLLAGFFETCAGSRNIEELRGIGYYHPEIRWLSVVLTASMAGIPLTYGCLAKTLVKTAIYSFEANALMLASGIFSIAYMGRLVYYFWGSKNSKEPKGRFCFPLPLRINGIILIVLATLPFWGLHLTTLPATRACVYNIPSLIEAVMSMLVASVLIYIEVRYPLDGINHFLYDKYKGFEVFIGNCGDKIGCALQKLHTGKVNDYILAILVSLAAVLIFMWSQLLL